MEVMLRARISMGRAAAFRSCLKLSHEKFLPRTNLRLSSSAVQKTDVDLKFEDGKEAFKSKTTSELLRAYLVLKLSSMDYIVNHNNQVGFVSKTLAAPHTSSFYRSENIRTFDSVYSIQFEGILASRHRGESEWCFVSSQNLKGNGGSSE